MHGRLKQLDIIRAVAVLLVIGCHWKQFVHDDSMSALDGLFCIGWSGVDMFFVLSGFLVSGLLFKEYKRYGTIDVVRFFIRRGLKIYPSFYALFFISMAAILIGFTPAHRVTNWRIFYEAIFLQNYHAGLWNHTWSLAVEEHFYLILAICVYLAIKRRPGKNPFKRIGLIVILVSISCAVMRLITYYRCGYDWFTIYAPTHLRGDSLAFGVLISYVYNFKRDKFIGWLKKHKWKIICVSSVLMFIGLTVSSRNPIMIFAGVPCLYVGFGGFLALSLTLGTEISFWNWKPVTLLTFIGEHSYSIYLWHMPVLRWTPMIFRRAFRCEMLPYPRFALYVLGSIIVGIVMAKIIELPALRMRDHLYPSRSSS